MPENTQTTDNSLSDMLPMAVDTLPPLYKFLRADGSAPTGTGRYIPNRWRSVSGVLVPGKRGLHATTADNLIPFLDAVLWRCESDGEFVWHEDASMRRKFVARRLRTVERIEAWNERTARLFAVKCAERTLPIFEREHPIDSRPRETLAVARRFADGQATRDELAAAADVAADVAADAALDEAWDAASAAAATKYAAWAAAAWAAAADAASAAAAAVAVAVASAAAWDAERQWQNRRLMELLELT